MNYVNSYITGHYGSRVTFFFKSRRLCLFQEEAALYRHLAAVLRHCLLLSCDGEDTLEELQGSDCCIVALNMTVFIRHIPKWMMKVLCKSFMYLRYLDSSSAGQQVPKHRTISRDQKNKTETDQIHRTTVTTPPRFWNNKTVSRRKEKNWISSLYL